MESTQKRNARARAFLGSLYEKALDPTFQPNETDVREHLEKLFQTSAWGFREILLVVVVGMALDPSFRASEEFYRCKPRAIYEGPIKEFLIEKHIPHRKSGPLNVAKATVGLDRTWAAQRRPSDVAEATVGLVHFLESASDIPSAVTEIGVALVRRLLEQAEKLSSLAVEPDPDADPCRLFALCKALIERAPDAGNTPQKIAALLLKSYHASLRTGIEVTGDDRASVASTASRKSGDLNEERSGEIYKVYEVTVKPFDLFRIRDSFDCISDYNAKEQTEIREVVVICRPKDCPKEMVASGLHTYLGQYRYRDVVYFFWDIFEWVAMVLQQMPSDGRRMFYLLLNSHVNDMNTAEKVKRLWRDLHL